MTTRYVRSEVNSEVASEIAMMCAHGHRWVSVPASTRCPVCGTATFKTVDEWAAADWLTSATGGSAATENGVSGG